MSNEKVEPTVICLDQKRPALISEPHGPWWLTVRIPAGRTRHVYVGASTSERFVPGSRSHSGRVLIDTSRLAVLVMPHRFYGRWRRDWVILHRFCAHLKVSDRA